MKKNWKNQRTHTRFGPSIAPREMSEEQKAIIIKHYIIGACPARDVAIMLGDQYGQHDIYIIARKLQRKLGLPMYDRRPESKVDWALVLELKNESMTDDDIAEFFKTNGNYIKRGRKMHA